MTPDPFSPRPKMTPDPFSGYGTMTMISFEGGPGPAPFSALTRTWYSPGGAAAVNAGWVDPVEMTARSDSPARLPAWTRYAVGAVPPAAGVHISLTCPSGATVACSPDGARGRSGPSVNETSLEAGPSPHGLLARTRTK